MAMPADFCSHYQPHKEVDRFIAEPGTDPDAYFHAFQRNYKEWLEIGAPGDFVSMVTVFGAPDVARKALEAGDTSQKREEGRVRGEDCAVFVSFVNEFETGAEATREYLSSMNIPPKESPDPLDAAFQEALAAYVLGRELTLFMRGLLNGACFVRWSYRPTGLSGADPEPLTEFYAVPGHHMRQDYRRNLKENFWANVEGKLSEAAEATGSRMVNLDLAIQLRLGEAPDLFPGQSPGSGIVIFGAG